MNTDEDAFRIFEILSSTFSCVLERKDPSFLYINNYILEGPDDMDFVYSDELIKAINTLLFDFGAIFIPLKDTSIVVKNDRLLLDNRTLNALIKKNTVQKKKE